MSQRSRSSPAPGLFTSKGKDACTERSQQEQSLVKAIPPFYCAYLLRSTVRHASLYIGSTPNPVRRLAQHNGRIKGGAHRTHREKLRPWEMVMIVSGFTSRTGALQFEWAWQNTQASRHAANSETETNVRICSKTGKRMARKSSNPRESLTSVVARLHLLLRSPYFSSWPLEVRFFKADVHRVWQGWTEAADTFVPGHIRFTTDFDDDGASGEEGRPLQNALQRLDISGTSLKSYKEKTQFILEAGERIDCGICHDRLRLSDDLIVICSCEACRCASHLLCLSSSFMESESTSNGFIPVNGRCPSCRSSIEWHVLMKEMTHRVRSHGTRSVHDDNSDAEDEEGDNPNQPQTIEEESGGELSEDVAHPSPIDLLSSSDDEDFGPSTVKFPAKTSRPTREPGENSLLTSYTNHPRKHPDMSISLKNGKPDEWDDIDIVE
ncbi:GIY-YIG catalytic domain-containing protein [Arthroderma uncinatum]|uniref:GIY-YIG catalytic domain-containing protein n=1 Tax=Arthroderma uncinatum TaxID=74035 RepID=UPI00144A7F3B|nr:GIY-YIG catalytic domain-containing protein [Arthroderma uncinatum]KAF3479513.1 GIY-YIG catalytic domain-containing protein [Arthroderma uncinatum]